MTDGFEDSTTDSDPNEEPDVFASVRNPNSRRSKAKAAPYSGSKMATSQKRRHAPTEKAKADFLAARVGGATVAEALEVAKRQYTTYSKWRADDPDFKAKADRIRIAKQVAKQRARLDPNDPDYAVTNERFDGTFGVFRDTYFPHEFPSPPFHLDIIERLEHAPPMSVSLVLVPPNFGKSSLMEDWINYKLAVDPNHRITVVSKGQKQAQKMLGLVQRRMTDKTLYDPYISSFGPFHDEDLGRNSHPWTANYFTTDLVTHDERDPSLQCLGWTSQVYGSRIDTLILDDIQTTDNLNLVDDMLTKLRLEYMSRGDRNARIFIVGTRIASGDIYERLIDEGTISDGCLIQYPALNGKGESLWPDRWPAHVLDNRGDKELNAGIRQRVGEKVWWTAYQQVPAKAGDATFDEAMMANALSPLHKVGRATPGEAVVIGVDPGLDPGATALVAMSYTADTITVLDAYKTSTFARQEDIIALIERFATDYSPTDVVIEKVAYQRALARDERLEALGRRLGFRIQEHNTGKNKLDPMFGVAAMAGSFLKAEVSIPDADDYARARMEPLVAELRNWRPNVPTRLLTQDLCMALWFGWLHIVNARHTMHGAGDQWRRAMGPGLGLPRRLRIA